MPGIEIPNLPAASSAEFTDIFPINTVPGDVTSKLSSSQLFTLFETQIIADGQPLTRVNDTNITLTLSGSPGNSLLAATALTLGWAGLLSPTRGGTGVNNSSNTLTLGGNLTTTGAFNSIFNMSSATNVNFPVSGTLATTSQLPVGAALTASPDTNITIALGGSPSTALLNAASITMGWAGLLSPARGGTGVNNSTNTLTLGGNLATSGLFNSTFTMTGATAVTFPTSGTLATTSQLPVPAALTKTDDVNVILTLGGSPGTSLLQATSLTLGWTGLLSPARGGTGVNNSTSTLTLGGNLALSGAFTSNFTMTGNTSVTFPTTGTLATTSSIPTGAALTATPDTNVTISLGGSPATALLNAASIALGWTGQLSLARGGSNASLTASNGGIIYSTASAMDVLAGTATAGQILRSGSTAAPSWTTTTYPATNALYSIMYATAANVLGSTAPVNGGIMVSDFDGKPYFAGPLSNGQIAIGSTGAAPVMATLTAGTGISIANSAGGISISSSGSFGAISASSLTFTSTAELIGTTTNNNANSGSVGEFISVVTSNNTSITTNTPFNAQLQTLQAGDYDIWGGIYFQPAVSASNYTVWINTVSATAPDIGLSASMAVPGMLGMTVWSPPRRFSFASSTTVYLGGSATFTGTAQHQRQSLFTRRRR